ncbi:MAG: hypothetical protein EXR27_19780 [Betaproteobacteria bacterium]|nr:hypothetical protein [Betaproteobacteria bacterium]
MCIPNAGVSLGGVGIGTFLAPVPLGIAVGLLAGLAVEGADSEYVVQTRLGVFLGSLTSAVLGLAILRAVLPRPETARLAT